MLIRLREDIRSIFERDPAARSLLEVLTCYPGLHALLFHRCLSAPCWRLGLYGLARWLSTVARWLTGIEIHPRATLGRRVFIDHGMGVVIGETAEVGDDCTLYHGVTLGGTSLQQEKRHPTLERGVVVGAGAKILGPIVIGEGARIGSNAVVVRSVPAGATAVGIPARVLVREEKVFDESITSSEAEKSTEATSKAPLTKRDDIDISATESAGMSAQAAPRVDDQVFEKSTFSAYAVGRDMNDPMVLTLHQLLEHVAKIEDRIGIMVKRLEAQGVDCRDLQPQEPPLDPATWNKMLE